MTGMEAIAVAVLLALQSGAPSDAAEMKALRENNIFSPKKAKREETRRDERRDRRESSSSSSSSPARPKPPVVTGIIRDTASGTYQAVVEDKNPASSSGPDLRQFKEPKFLKAGDALLTYTIESVEIDKVGVKCGETSKTLKVGESFPDDGASALRSSAPEGAKEGESSTSTAAPAPAKPPPTAAESAEMDDIKKKMKERTKKNRSYDTPE